jgi:hypothetical protein
MKRVSYRGLCYGAALLVSAGVGASAAATDIKGSLTTKGERKASGASSPRAPYWQEWNGFIEPKKNTVDLTREVSVVLIGAEGSKDATTVRLTGGQLYPQTLVMQQGTSLRVRNEDDFTHKLFADGLAAFDAIETSPGQGRQIQVDQAGSFALHDVLSPHVTGTLHVLPKVTQVALPKADGSYVLSGVSPGSYTLKVFFGDKEVSSSTLDVTSTRDVVVDPVAIDVTGGK